MVIIPNCIRLIANRGNLVIQTDLPLDDDVHEMRVLTLGVNNLILLVSDLLKDFCEVI